MSWSANISLKSGRNTIVSDLVSINVKDLHDSSVKKLEDFKDFHLTPKQFLSFVGERDVVSVISDEIEYIEINQQG